jgi:2-polyprenyl-3-methyl-5-hydroxy-6-metoxy-1,4-benzoquinol methylase
MDPQQEAQIQETWRRNAAPWAAAVRDQRIDSRRLVTDQAIVDAIVRQGPRRVLDAGCGEGWLTRRLSALGMDVLGTDAEPALIAAATAAGGTFRVLSYAELDAGALPETFDAVVCNFALLGRDSTEALFRAAPRLLRPAGALIVQTLHPHGAGDALPYADGWRDGSWAGCGEGFSAPAPWYFRTLESWMRLFCAAGLPRIELQEPLHPDTGRPASVIFVGRRA